MGEWTPQARRHDDCHQGGEEASMKGQRNGSRARWQVSVTLSAGSGEAVTSGQCFSSKKGVRGVSGGAEGRDLKIWKQSSRSRTYQVEVPVRDIHAKEA